MDKKVKMKNENEMNTAQFLLKTTLLATNGFASIYLTYTDRAETAHACVKTRNFEPR